MSRNDTYLSLCLEQASLSPLHYRHGCIVVRGGKVIGKGYNDYRSGFNGGAQSTGHMGTAGATEYGPKPKNAKILKSTIAANGHPRGTFQNSKRSSKTYVAFESQNHAVGTGGGTLANTPLSMHSEMMAINSALSLSSAIACQGTARSTQWLEKPCFKLPSRSKRQIRLQHLKAYADAVYRNTEEQNSTSERRGGSHVQQYRFESAASQPDAALPGELLRRGGGGGEENEGVETSEHKIQQCPPPRSNQLSRVSEVQFPESAAASERQQRETAEAVPVRHSRKQSVSPSRPSQEGTDGSTCTTAT